MSADETGWLTDPVECGRAAGFGIYLHVPFCSHRCGYCDFATAAVEDARDAELPGGLFDTYTEALIADLRAQIAGAVDPVPVTSVFVGGGTPTLLGGQRLTSILAALASDVDIAPDAEITIECNPETSSVALFEQLAAAGATRVSMGAQSFTPNVLTTLERGHDAERPLRAADEARRAGIEQLNLDLIYGTPGERDTDWERTLDVAVAAPVDHISAYALTIHDNTPFGSAVARGSMPTVDEDVQRARFDVASSTLERAGFEHYEVSNFARGSRRRSRHNLLYWRHGDYLGVGVGAHGHRDGTRRWTTRSTDRYLRAHADGRPPETGSEQLTVDERAIERLMLGLRVREGLHPNDVPPLAAIAVEDALRADLIEFSCGRLRSTRQGWFLLDETVTLLAPGA